MYNIDKMFPDIVTEAAEMFPEDFQKEVHAKQGGWAGYNEIEAILLSSKIFTAQVYMHKCIRRIAWIMVNLKLPWTDPWVL